MQGRRRREDRMEGFSPEYEREGERRCRAGGGERTGWRGSVQSMRERTAPKTRKQKTISSADS